MGAWSPYCLGYVAIALRKPTIALLQLISIYSAHTVMFPSYRVMREFRTPESSPAFGELLLTVPYHSYWLRNRKPFDIAEYLPTMLVFPRKVYWHSKNTLFYLILINIFSKDNGIPEKTQLFLLTCGVRYRLSCV